jgi:hypothetical protein
LIKNQVEQTVNEVQARQNKINQTRADNKDNREIQLRLWWIGNFKTHPMYNWLFQRAKKEGLFDFKHMVELRGYLLEIKEKWEEDSVKDQIRVAEEFNSGTCLERNICNSSSLSKMSIKAWHRSVYAKGWFDAIWAFGRLYDQFANFGARQKNLLTQWELTGYDRSETETNVLAGTDGWRVIMEKEVVAHCGTATS